MNTDNNNDCLILHCMTLYDTQGRLYFNDTTTRHCVVEKDTA